MTSPEQSTGGHESAPEVPPVSDPELDAIRAERLAAMELSDVLDSQQNAESHKAASETTSRDKAIGNAASDVYALFQEAGEQSNYDMGEVVRVQRNARDGNEAYMQDGWRVTGKLANGDLRVQMTDDQGMKLTKMATPDMLDAWRAPEESIDTENQGHRDINSIDSQTSVLYEDALTSAYEPRVLGSKDGDWDFVRDQREGGRDVSVDASGEVSVTDAEGNVQAFGSIDAARAALEKTDEAEAPVSELQAEAAHEGGTDAQGDVVRSTLLTDSKEAPRETHDVLAAVEASISMHTAQRESTANTEHAQQEETQESQLEVDRSTVDTERSRQAVEVFSKRVAGALEETSKLDKRMDQTLGEAHEMLRQEIVRLNRTPGNRLDIVAPAVRQTIENVEEMVRRARSIDNQKEKTAAEVGAIARNIAQDEQIDDAIKVVADESGRKLRHRDDANEELKIAFSMVRSIGTRPNDSRDDAIFRMRRLAAKLDEIRQQQRNDPHQRRRLDEVRSVVQDTLGSIR